MRAPRVALCVGFIRLSPTMGSCTVHLADEEFENCLAQLISLRRSLVPIRYSVCGLTDRRADQHTEERLERDTQTKK